MNQLADGIYFGLSDDVYHAQKRFSASGMIKLMESPSSFWASSWMNPDRPEPEETDAQEAGSAYHCARLEPEEFENRYYRAPDPDDYPDALMNDTDVKARLKALDLTQKPAGEDMDTRAARLAAHDDKAVIWRIVMEEARVEAGDRRMISPALWDRVQRDARNFTDNPELAELITGGAAEVAILWTCAESGLACKCKVDYLRAETWVDIKTWGQRAFGKPGNEIIHSKFRYDGHHRACWHYHEGVEQIRLGNVGAQGDVTEAQTDLLHAIRTRTVPLEPWFIYQRQDGVPDIRARQVEIIHAAADGETFEPGMMGRKGMVEVHACKIAFINCCKIYGTDGDPWFPLDMIGKIADGDFHENWLTDKVEPS